MDRTRLEYFMKAALQEGRKALPNCLPNPPVGCVIVKDGEIIARGHTNEPGQPHAEAMALEQLAAGEREVELFVTLEPCSFHGRTPSCAQAIGKRQIERVFVGMIDPHPKNNGVGIELLKAAGVEVHVGVLEEEVEADLGPYLSLET